MALIAADLGKRVKQPGEPEQGVILMFLRSASGKVFVPYTPEAGPDVPPLTPGASLHLATFPTLKRRVWSFSGETPSLAGPLAKA